MTWTKAFWWAAFLLTLPYTLPFVLVGAVIFYALAAGTDDVWKR